MLPNFIIGGTAAGGTSFLSAAIIQHPQIYLPKKMRPEPHYFYKSWEYEKPISYYKEKYFKDVKDEIAVGERSSSYLFGGLSVSEKIAQVLPNVKFIFTLRNPIERAYANYRYTALQGLEEVSFEEALFNEQNRIKNQKGIWAEIQPYNYTERGMYANQIRDYLKFFKEDQMLFIKSEEMNKKPYEIFKKVFDFLGVDTSFKPKLPPNFTSLSVKDPKLQKYHRNFFKEKFDLIVEAIRREEDPFQYINSIEEKNELEKMLLNIKKNKIPMSNEAREYLQKLYEKPNKELEKYIYFDIGDWN